MTTNSSDEFAVIGRRTWRVGWLVRESFDTVDHSKSLLSTSCFIAEVGFDQADID